MGSIGKTEGDQIRISVRNLVEFILRSGDIDNRSGGAADPETMQMGSRMHRQIQKRMGAQYQAEVPLVQEFPCEDFTIILEGRADGIFTKGDQVWIDEIKGVFRDLKHLEEPEEVHLAQAKCYAYMYALQNGAESMGVQMTYASLETEEIRRFQEVFSFEDLEEWFEGVLGEYRKWAIFRHNWIAERTKSIHGTVFPFPYRKGQKKLAEDVYRTISRGKKVFIQAPTGTGKTLAVLFPAVKAMGEGMGDTLFYMTARTIARTVAEEGFGLLRENGLKMKTVTLTAKEKICFLDDPDCNPAACPYAKGHFDRINEAVFAVLEKYDSFTRERIRSAAEEYRVCPFEMSLDISTWTDAVIGDYNYVFHPRSRLKRFFGEGVRGDYLFLIDEAHNLVDRGRDMYSAHLIREDIMEVRRVMKERSPRIYASLGKCSRQLLALKKECEAQSPAGKYVILPGPGAIPLSVMNACGVIEEYLEEQRKNRKVPDAEEKTGNEKLLDLYFSMNTFLDVCDRLDQCYVTYARTLENGHFMLRLFCVDPSVNLQKCLDKGRSSMFFSATLLPVDYYKQMLSTQTDNYAVYADSCFDPSRLQILIGTDTSSRYTDRSPEQYARTAAYIREAVLARKGNYMVFFSSYRMLEETADAFLSILPEDCDLLRQTSGMSEQEREEFLQTFSSDRDRSLAGFCVMGSIFGEGIDLRSDRLIGVIIVGTGLPQVCAEQDILRAYYDGALQDGAGAGKAGDGFRCAYICPGMNKVLQAAGRVIRTEEDRGVVLLLDERFTRSQYRSMFPREWTRVDRCTVRTAGKKLKDFWDEE